MTKKDLFVFDETMAETLRNRKYSNIEIFDYDEEENLLFVNLEKKISKVKDNKKYQITKCTCIDIYGTETSKRLGSLEISSKTFYPGIGLSYKSEGIQQIINALQEKGYVFEIEKNQNLANFYGMKDISEHCYTPTNAYWEKQDKVMEKLTKEQKQRAKNIGISEKLTI